MKSSLKTLLLEPYRLFFAAGALSAILSIALWFAWLHGLEQNRSLLHWLQAPARVHSHTMIFGVVGFYVFGFLLTAFPKWIGGQPVAKRTLLFLFLNLFFSQIFFWAGAAQDARWMIPAGIMESAAYLSLLILLSRLYLCSPLREENRQPLFVLIGLFLGTSGVISSYFYYLFPQSSTFYTLGLNLGTYGYLLFLIVAVTFRIIPFFTSRVVSNYQVRRGKHTLQIVLGLILLKILSGVFSSSFSPGPWVNEGADLLLLIVLTREWFMWKPWNAAKTPLLFVHYLALFWIVISLGFSSLEGLMALFAQNTLSAPLKTSALHALFIGAFGTLIVGISTRVVRGHGGHSMRADAFALAALLFIQLAALWRIAIPFLEKDWPLLAGKSYWAGLFWCAAFGVWAVRYLPFLFMAPASEKNFKIVLPTPV